MKNKDGIHGQLLVNHLLDGVGRDRVAFPVDGALRHNDDVQPLACLPGMRTVLRLPKTKTLRSQARVEIFEQFQDFENQNQKMQLASLVPAWHRAPPSNWSPVGTRG